MKKYGPMHVYIAFFTKALSKILYTQIYWLNLFRYIPRHKYTQITASITDINIKISSCRSQHDGVWDCTQCFEFLHVLSVSRISSVSSSVCLCGVAPPWLVAESERTQTWCPVYTSCAGTSLWQHYHLVVMEKNYSIFMKNHVQEVYHCTIQNSTFVNSEDKTITCLLR